MKSVQGPPKNLLLIGATSSLGPAIARLAQTLDYQITGTFRTAQKRFREISQWLELDLSRLTSIENFLLEIQIKHYDLIIFLPGITNPKKINLQEYIETHFLHTIILFDRLTQRFAIDSSCCFIFVSSRAAKYPSFDIYYSAIKSGLSAALKSLSAKTHPKSRFLSILPGLITDSGMYWEMPPEIRESHKLRSANSLLSLDEAALAIFEVIQNRHKYANGEMLEIGPIYT